MPTIQLAALCAQYIECHMMSKSYVQHMRNAVEKLAECGIVDSTQLTSQALNLFLENRPKQTGGWHCGEGDATRANLRRIILTLWKWGFAERLLAEKPERIRPIAVVLEPPTAWSFDQLCELLSIAEKDEAVVSLKWCLRRCDVLPCWIRIGYESGLRFSDIHLLKKVNFRNGCLVRVASKTRTATIRTITPDTQLSIDRLLARSTDGSLFRWALPRKLAQDTWKSFMTEHGLEGTSKYLRKTGATLIEKEHPGGATAFLSHSDPRLAATHYIDVTLLGPPQGPPAIQRR